MKNGSYTTTLPIELEFIKPDGDNFYKEFEIEFSTHWVNDGIGWTEAWGVRSFHKGNDYLENLDDWKILSEANEEEKSAIEEYIDKNEEKILEEMGEKYDPMWDCEY